MRVGAHPLVCWRDGYTKDVRTVVVREAEDVVVDCRTQAIATQGAQEVWAWVAAGGGLASAGAATFLLISYQQDLKKADRDNQNMESNQHIFGGVFAVSAVALGLGSYFLFQSASADDADERIVDDERIGWQVVPVVGPDGGLGAAAAFTF